MKRKNIDMFKKARKKQQIVLCDPRDPMFRWSPQEAAEFLRSMPRWYTGKPLNTEERKMAPQKVKKEY